MYASGWLFEWLRTYYKMGIAISSPAHLEMELQRAKDLQLDLLKSYVRLPDLRQSGWWSLPTASASPWLRTKSIQQRSLADSTEHT